MSLLGIILGSSTIVVTLILKYKHTQCHLQLREFDYGQKLCYEAKC